MKMIYMDHAATTPVAKEVVEAMKPYFSQKFGNPSSMHALGQEAREALENSREAVVKFLGAKEEELIFTSGGTESNNLALKGVAFANRERGKHIITSSIEHPCVLEACKWLETQGFEVTYLPVDEHGLVSLEELTAAMREDTILVSIMHANNEIGTIQQLEEIGKVCKESNAYFHTDAVQSFGKIPINIRNVDLLSISAHKLYGPKGIGALFVRNSMEMEPILHGGGHEFGIRSGTENVAGAAGFAKAVELAKKDMKKESSRQVKLRDRLISGALEIPDSRLNGHPTKRLPNNANLSFSYIEGEALVLRLSDKGVAASTGSACSSKDLEPSHVLTSIGLSHVQAHGSLRLTLGRQNTKDDVDYVVKTLPGIVQELRRMSPLGRKVKA